MPLVLIVDDEVELASLVEFNLRAVGLEVSTAHSGEAGLALLRGRCPDLVVLDLVLPDVSGHEVCRRIRRDLRARDVAVLMLTARGDEAERVDGFMAGADDYVTKPFSMRELVLRVQTLLKRQARPAMTVLECGPLSLDVALHRFFVQGVEVPLTAIEFKLMLDLLAHADRVRTREALNESVWGQRGPPTGRTLDTHLMRLRPKLGPARERLETVRGVGFRLVNPG